MAPDPADAVGTADVVGLSERLRGTEPSRRGRP
jgi:hypothetical protein